MPGDVRMLSLADCVVDALAQRGGGPALILSTVGTRVSRVFTRPLDTSRIRYVEPSARVQDELMRAIYEGVKALDWDIAAAAGANVLENVLAANPGIGCIVAGCTEVPEIIDLLKQRGSSALRKRLAKIEVIDPVELALNAIACNGRAA